MKMRTSLVAVFAVLILSTTAFPALAAPPLEPEAAGTVADCSATPLMSVSGEAPQGVEIGEMKLAPPTAEAPIAMSTSCEEDCMNVRWACVAACPGNPGEPANDACRSDCFYDYQLCMNDCWCCMFPGFP